MLYQAQQIFFTTGRLVFVFACLGWVSTSAAEADDDEWTTQLRYSDQIPRAYSPNHFDLATEPPEDDWILPKARGRERLSGSWRVGHSTQLNVVLDVMGERECVMRFAFDDDVNFGNKPDVSEPRAPVTFKIRYRDGKQEPYTLRFYYSPAFSERIGKKRLMFYRGSLRSGSLESGDKRWKISLSDSNADGDYSDLANTMVLIDRNGDGSFQTDEGIRAETPFPLDGTYYSVVRISASGERMTIRKAILGKIEGRVADHEGQTAKGATVGIMGHALSAPCDAQGKFVLEAPVGRYNQLTARADGYVPQHTRLREMVDRERPRRVDFILQPISKQLSGEIRIANGQSYHFLAGKVHDGRGGDFSVGVSGSTVKLYANHLFQRGVMALGDLGDVDLTSVEIPKKRTTRAPLEAVVGNTYVALAKAGEEGHYVVFRLKDVTPDKSVTIQYQYR